MNQVITYFEGDVTDLFEKADRAEARIEELQRKIASVSLDIGGAKGVPAAAQNIPTVGTTVDPSQNVAKAVSAQKEMTQAAQRGSSERATISDNEARRVPARDASGRFIAAEKEKTQAVQQETTKQTEIKLAAAGKQRLSLEQELAQEKKAADEYNRGIQSKPAGFSDPGRDSASRLAQMTAQVNEAERTGKDIAEIVEESERQKTQAAERGAAARTTIRETDAQREKRNAESQAKIYAENAKIREAQKPRRDKERADILGNTDEAGLSAAAKRAERDRLDQAALIKKERTAQEQFEFKKKARAKAFELLDKSGDSRFDVQYNKPKDVPPDDPPDRNRGRGGARSLLGQGSALGGVSRGLGLGGLAGGTAASVAAFAVISGITKSIEAYNKEVIEASARNARLKTSSIELGISQKELSENVKSVAGSMHISEEAAEKLIQPIAELSSAAQKPLGDLKNAIIDLASARGVSKDDLPGELKSISEGSESVALNGKNASAIFDIYASSISTTADKLTKAQKAQALTNDLMRQGTLHAGDAANALANQAVSVDQLEKSYEKAKQSVGGYLAVAAQVALNKTTKLTGGTPEYGRFDPAKASSAGYKGGLNKDGITGLLGGLSNFIPAKVALFGFSVPEKNNPLEIYKEDLEASAKETRIKMAAITKAFKDDKKALDDAVKSPTANITNKALSKIDQVNSVYKSQIRANYNAGLSADQADQRIEEYVKFFQLSPDEREAIKRQAVVDAQEMQAVTIKAFQTGIALNSGDTKFLKNLLTSASKEIVDRDAVDKLAATAIAAIKEVNTRVQQSLASENTVKEASLGNYFARADSGGIETLKKTFELRASFLKAQIENDRQTYKDALSVTTDPVQIQKLQQEFAAVNQSKQNELLVAEIKLQTDLIAKQKEMKKTLEDTFAGFAGRSDNPYLKFLSDADQRMSRLKESTKDFSPVMQKFLADMERAATAREKYKLDLDTRVEASDLQQGAKKFRQGFVDGSADDPAIIASNKRLEDVRARADQLREKFKNDERAQKNIDRQEREAVRAEEKRVAEERKQRVQADLDRQLSVIKQDRERFSGSRLVTQKPGESTADAFKRSSQDLIDKVSANAAASIAVAQINDQKLIQFAQSLNPADLREDQRNAIANAFDRESIRKLKAEKDAQNERITIREGVQALVKQGEKGSKGGKSEDTAPQGEASAKSQQGTPIGRGVEVPGGTSLAGSRQPVNTFDEATRARLFPQIMSSGTKLFPTETDKYTPQDSLGIKPYLIRPNQISLDTGKLETLATETLRREFLYYDVGRGEDIYGDYNTRDKDFRLKGGTLATGEKRTPEIEARETAERDTARAQINAAAAQYKADDLKLEQARIAEREYYKKQTGAYPSLRVDVPSIRDDKDGNALLGSDEEFQKVHGRLPGSRTITPLTSVDDYTSSLLRDKEERDRQRAEYKKYLEDKAINETPSGAPKVQPQFYPQNDGSFSLDPKGLIPAKIEDALKALQDGLKGRPPVIQPAAESKFDTRKLEDRLPSVSEGLKELSKTLQEFKAKVLEGETSNSLKNAGRDAQNPQPLKEQNNQTPGQPELIRPYDYTLNPAPLDRDKPPLSGSEGATRLNRSVDANGNVTFNTTPAYDRYNDFPPRPDLIEPQRGPEPKIERVKDSNGETSFLTKGIAAWELASTEAGKQTELLFTVSKGIGSLHRFLGRILGSEGGMPINIGKQAITQLEVKSKNISVAQRSSTVGGKSTAETMDPK